jgi:hypothetical protein
MARTRTVTKALSDVNLVVGGEPGGSAGARTQSVAWQQQ